MAGNHFKTEQTCRVIEAHKPTPGDPLLVKAGEVLTVGRNDTQWPAWVRCTNSAGKSGWMPENYLDRSEDQGVARYDYDATELVANAGEEVVVGFEESGWVWCTNSRGQSGWLPADKVTGA